MERGAAEARVYSVRRDSLAGLALGDFGRGGAREAALRRRCHALRLPPGLLAIAARRLGRRGAERAAAAIERYAYWHGARTVLDRDTWRRLTTGTVVLMYHAFGGAGERPSRFVVPGRRFEHQLRWLRRSRHPLLSLAELADLRERGELPPPGAVVITIDDGYADNLAVAAPLLERYRAPATVFVVSGRVGGVADWDGAGELAGRRLLDWDEVDALRRAGIDIGAHTRTHPRLPELDPATARDEIHGSRADLRERLRAPIRAFAYPFGRAGHSEAVVAAAGFDLACGIERGLNYPGTPALALRRAPIDGDASLRRFKRAVRSGDPDVAPTLLAAARRRALGHVAPAAARSLASEGNG